MQQSLSVTLELNVRCSASRQCNIVSFHDFVAQAAFNHQAQLCNLHKSNLPYSHLFYLNQLEVVNRFYGRTLSTCKQLMMY